jgi:hypothetical protein
VAALAQDRGAWKEAAPWTNLKCYLHAWTCWFAEHTYTSITTRTTTHIHVPSQTRSARTPTPTNTPTYPHSHAPAGTTHAHTHRIYSSLCDEHIHMHTRIAPLGACECGYVGVFVGVGVRTTLRHHLNCIHRHTNIHTNALHSDIISISFITIPQWHTNIHTNTHIFPLFSTHTTQIHTQSSAWFMW